MRIYRQSLVKSPDIKNIIVVTLTFIYIALNVLLYPILEPSKVSQIKRVKKRVKLFYSDVLNFEAWMTSLLRFTVNTI